jgi:DNA-binding NarL/FixJ family response regulator
MTSQTTRILIADDHELIREGLRQTLGRQPGWEICAEAADGQTALDLARHHLPSVAVLDFSMPGMTGLEVARRLNTSLPEVKVLILTAYETSVLATDVLAAGASGILLKSDAAQLIVSAVDSILHQKTFFSSRRAYMSNPAPKPEPVASNELSGLTPRELEVLRLVAEGMTSREIGGRLGITEKTVEAHRSNFMGKLNLRSVGEVVRFAIRHNVVAA